MKKSTLFSLMSCLALASHAIAELRVPAFTGYVEPDPGGVALSEANGISNWKDADKTVSWFGELKAAGTLTASLAVKESGRPPKYELEVEGQKREASAKDGVVSFGEFKIAKPGYVRFRLKSLNRRGDSGSIESLVLDGPAVADAHFNLKERRNAASVHLAYPTPADAKITMFYNEVTAVEDPLATYYMACGFSRGYFGMQVNNPKERRIIFSVWDAASGSSAQNRSTVEKENHTKLVAKGEGVNAEVFGNEGTGGHSHLKYNWKTGSTQRFLLVAKPQGDHTIYSGFWFHPDKKEWMLIACFDAPKDGNYLKGLYSFSENFDGANGQLRRKALFGNQWIQLEGDKWEEITKATFSHDGTGKEDRLDRFMGVENGRFFLSQGGFVEGSSKYGDPFTRPASSGPPKDLKLPELPAKP
jgi:hypothetical protein